ncbi:MAG: O-succinylbenzoic acid--CoA ligase, partial [Bacteroidetes bacterium]|nr:O-succinylbenzoic acid--CoA ligase [Bacteroidota bacterium]
NFNSYIDFTAFVPNQLYDILHSPLADRINKIEKIIIGGGPMTEETANLLHNYKCEVYHTYGMTETLSHVAIQQINPPGRKSYTALPGVLFSVDDRHCLLVNAPKFCEEEIITNDVVILHNDKQFDWIGRYDNIINSGGIKLNPETIESKLRPLVSVPFIVSSAPDEKLSSKLILVVENNVSLDLDALNKHLGKYEQIKEIHNISHFNYTDSGKIKRKAL